MRDPVDDIDFQIRVAIERRDAAKNAAAELPSPKVSPTPDESLREFIAVRDRLLAAAKEATDELEALYAKRLKSPKTEAVTKQQFEPPFSQWPQNPAVAKEIASGIQDARASFRADAGNPLPSQVVRFDLGDDDSAEAAIAKMNAEVFNRGRAPLLRNDGTESTLTYDDTAEGAIARMNAEVASRGTRPLGT